jgi:hypothetical protein
LNKSNHLKAADADKLNQIIADVGPDGTTETKQAFIADYKSPPERNERNRHFPTTGPC